jgi:hypothetical protein
MTNDRLEARVRAVNLCNEVCGVVFARLKARLAPFVGKLVTKADGTLRENVKASLAGIWEDYEKRTPDGCRITITTNFMRAGFAWAVYVSAPVGDPNGDHTVQSAEQSVYVGDLDGQTLRRLNDCDHARRTDYSAAEIRAQREKVKQLEAVFSEEKAKLFPFGEYDR